MEWGQFIAHDTTHLPPDVSGNHQQNITLHETHNVDIRYTK